MCWTAHFAQRVRMATAVAVVLLAGPGLTLPAVAGTVFVSTSGNDENDGLTWATAKQTVQAGLNAAVGGDEVWVAAGTYVENITLKDGVALYGGFAGGETDLAQRDWVTNKTILDGNQADHVVTSPQGATATTRIDGFTIRDGSAGIYCYSSSPTIANNTITGNSYSGIYCDHSSSPAITNNTIAGNSSSGIYCRYSFSPVITNNAITGNTASFGGGIFCTYSSPTIANNTITGNSARVGGGVFSGYRSSPTLVNTIIAFNSSGICMESTDTLTLRYNCVYGNTDCNYDGITDPTGTDGNISADPKLADAAYGNVHIQPDSPCKDAGDDSVVVPGWLDIDGQARIQGAHVDIGADESNGTVWPAGPYVILRVSPDGDDANDGSSWALAKRTVQAGVDATSLLGGEVWVQAGTYYERITLRPHAYLYGGFAGTEAEGSSRDWIANVAILDGQQGGSVVTVMAGHHVSRIDGFTIRNGRASSFGGGINCYQSSPAIANNTITGNSGSGIDCSDNSSSTITNNTITGNSGNGIYCHGSPSPTITNNTITGNSVSGIYGGYSSATIANTIIAFNSSGIYVDSTGTLTLRHNCVYGNTDCNYDGVIDPTGTDGNISADPKLADAAYGNLHIQPDSPCRDAGDDAVVQGDWLDIDGQARIQGDHVDIGADESDGTVWSEGPYAIVRVATDGDDANDGSSWSLAKRTLQAGIDAASALGGEVWVQAGTYNEQITLRSYSYLFGGFAGTESARDERDWTSNPTILDGQQGGSVVSILAGYQVSRIDGFTIRNGSVGISCSASSPTIASNTITGNSRGGIDCSDSSSPVITNNTISGNTTEYGGGIYCYLSSPTIEKNTITGNTSIGIWCSYSSPTIASNTIAGNADRGIHCYNQSSPAITNNTITRNFYSGIYCCDRSSPVITSNAITGNSGNGIDCSDSSSPTITNNTITGNSGIGIFGYQSSLTVVNTIVVFNECGIYMRNVSTVTLRYNCVYGNADYNYSGVTDPTGTDGNISADPLFVRPAGPGPDGQWGTADDDCGDLRLSNGSPCIDAGDNAAVPADTLDLDGDGDTTEPLPFDLLGGLRFFDDPFTIDTGLGTPPIVDMGAYEHVPMPAALESSIPANGRSLWRNRRNIIRLTFDADIAAPDAGAVMIQEMLTGGTYGDDLSAGFTFTMENDGQGQPRVLKIRETGSSLTHRKWYAVRNTGAWTAVAPFTVQYVVQVGDANNDSRVLNTDFGWVNAAIPTFSTADDDRRDINGDRRILNTDFGVLNSKIPSFPVAKPAGH